MPTAPAAMAPRRAAPRGAALALALLACLCMATAAPASPLAVDMSEEAKEYAREAGHAHWHGHLHRLASVTVGERRMGDLLGPILRHKYELPPGQVRARARGRRRQRRLAQWCRLGALNGAGGGGSGGSACGACLGACRRGPAPAPGRSLAALKPTQCPSADRPRAQQRAAQPLPGS
jgi:hypothetical protein